MTEAAIRFDQVSLAFGPIAALREVSAQIPGGVVAGIAGPDGAGKTTLARLAVGLLAPDRGAVRTLGRELPRAAAQVKTEIGYLPQRLGLLGHLTVRENLEYFGALSGVSPSALAERLNDLLRQTGLAGFERRLAQHLSGGMRQKLAFACAVLHQPRLAILDEPTTGIDPLSRRDMWELIYGLLGAGRSVVVATPSWEEAARCQWLMVLHEGRVLASGEPPRLAEAAAGLVWEMTPRPGVEQALRRLPWVISVGRRGTALRVAVSPQMRQGAVAAALEQAAPGSHPQPAAPNLEDAVTILTRSQ